VLIILLEESANYSLGIFIYLLIDILLTPSEYTSYISSIY